MKSILLYIFLLVSYLVNSQELTTIFRNDLQKWSYENYQFNTIFFNDFSKWECKDYQIRTAFIKDWDNWRIGGDVTIKTTFHDSFYSWIITGYGKTIYVKTLFQGNLNKWTLSGDSEGKIETQFHNDFEKWNIQISNQNLPEELKLAIVFISIFTSFHDESQ